MIATIINLIKKIIPQKEKPNISSSNNNFNCCDWINKDNDSSGFSQTLHTTLISGE